MEPTRCTVNGRPGRVKRIRLRDDGSTVAHIRLDDGPLLVVPVDAVAMDSTGLAEAAPTASEVDDGPEDPGQAAGDDQG